MSPILHISHVPNVLLLPQNNSDLVIFLPTAQTKLGDNNLTATTSNPSKIG